MEESSLPTQDTTSPPQEVVVVSSAPQCAESSGKSNDVASGEGEGSLKLSDELMEKGVKASKDHDYAEAVDCFSRALEIRVAYHGELSPECVNAFYKYGCALLYKAQEESDPLGVMPKKDTISPQDSDKDTPKKNVVAGALATDISAQEKNLDQEASSGQDEAGEGEGEGEGSGDDVVGEGDEDEDESDLDLAWKMLDLARAITEKDPGDTIEKVDILSALAEVALEREDIDTSLSDYHKALAILERLAEPDSRYIAELNFRICLCFEFGCRASEAIPYCQKATSICKSRVQRLTEEVKSMPEAASEKEAEITTLSDLLGELEKKLEDLQQQVMNPKSILSDILGLMSAKARNADGGSSSSAGVSAKSEAPSVSTAAPTNGNPAVTNLGVVGRGVKRVTPTSCDGESNSVKRPAFEPSNDKGDAS